MAFEWGIIDLLLPGQLLVLHEVDSDNDPVQSLPPWKGPFLDLERVLLPEPHVFVQSLQAAQEFQVQSTENQSKIPDKYKQEGNGPIDSRAKVMLSDKIFG